MHICRVQTLNGQQAVLWKTIKFQWEKENIDNVDKPFWDAPDAV